MFPTLTESFEIHGASRRVSVDLSPLLSIPKYPFPQQIRTLDWQLSKDIVYKRIQ